MYCLYWLYFGDVDWFEVVVGVVGIFVCLGLYGDGCFVGGLGGVLDEFVVVVNLFKVVGVCLIGFQQGEFWVVVEVDVFVVKGMVEFEYLFYVVDVQVFEVEFWCDVQEQIYGICVDVCDEWLGGGVVVQLLQDWCFDFDEFFCEQCFVYSVQYVVVSGDQCMGFSVDCQVEVMGLDLGFGIQQFFLFIW